jgi:hypothetical protein
MGDPVFLEFCGKVRNNDLSILPVLGQPFVIRRLSEREGIELSDALLKNTNITYLELGRYNYAKSYAEAMAKYVRSSKHLQRIRWNLIRMTDGRVLRHREEMLCCLLPAIQESSSLKELHLTCLSLVGRPTWRLKTC